MSDSAPTTTRRTRLIAVAAGLAVLVVLGLIGIRLVGGDDDTGGQAGPSASDIPASPTDEPSPTDAPRPGQPARETTDTGTKAAPAKRGPIRVAFSQSAKPTKDLRVSVSKVEKVRSRAKLPGETSRPALRITVDVDNTTGKTVPIGSALTNVYFGPGRAPATLVARPGGKPFPAQVPPGGSASGVFVYNVPEQARRQVLLEVIVDSKARTVEFAGDCRKAC